MVWNSFHACLEYKRLSFFIYHFALLYFPKLFSWSKKKRKKKKLYGVSLFRILKCFARIFQRTKTANSWRVYRWKKNTKTLVEMLILQFSEDNLRGTAKFISLKNYHRREERKKYQINHIGFILFFVLRFALFFKMS